MSSDRFAGYDPASGTDTGGTPWAGRTLRPTGSEGDGGEATAALEAALDRPHDEITLVAAVAAARLIVPVVAVAGSVDASGGDASSELAAVTLVAPDGARALPAFSSMAALAAWDPSARPVPVTAQRAALAAVQEGCQEIVLDLGGAAITLRGSMVWALAMARTWVPAHQDPHVLDALRRAVARTPEVLNHRVAPGAGGALSLTLVLPTDLAPGTVDRIAGQIGAGLAADGEVRARIDALAFVVEPA